MRYKPQNIDIKRLFLTHTHRTFANRRKCKSAHTSGPVRFIHKKMASFASLSDKVSFPAEEEKILAYWNEINAFHTSLKLSEGKPEYTFYDGPPFATGTPHYG